MCLTGKGIFDTLLHTSKAESNIWNDLKQCALHCFSGNILIYILGVFQAIIGKARVKSQLAFKSKTFTRECDGTLFFFFIHHNCFILFSQYRSYYYSPLAIFSKDLKGLDCLKFSEPLFLFLTQKLGILARDIPQDKADMEKLDFSLVR